MRTKKRKEFFAFPRYLTRRVVGNQRTTTRTQQLPFRVARSSIHQVFYSLGASPKWVLRSARQFKLGFGCTNFPRILYLKSSLVFLIPFSLLAAGLGYRFGTHHFAQILAIRASPQNPLRNGATLNAIAPTQKKKITELQNRPPKDGIRIKAHWEEKN